MADRQRSNIADKGNNLAGYTSIAPAPKSVPGKRDVEKPIGKTTNANPIGRRYLEPIGPTKPKSIPRSYVPSRIKQIFDSTPFATPPAKKAPAKKPPAAAKPTTRGGSTTLTKKATPRNMPPATRFGTVTGKTTGTTVRGGGGYGGGGTRGGGSLSGQGSGSRTAGTSRTGGTKQNNPVRG
jgi:hypothetical protein